MASWQVGLKIKLEPGINGETAELVVDLDAPENARYTAITEALAALMHRTEVSFAIQRGDPDKNNMLRAKADGQV